MIAAKEIIADWTRVEALEVDSRVFKTYEFHVVTDRETARTMLTIKIYNEENHTVRLDPTDISRIMDQKDYHAIAERRVRALYSNGLI